MTDQNTPENPDVTPTEAIELADQQPVGPESPSAASEPEKPGARHTRTILEIVGAAAAVVLIAAAAAGGFAAGLAVGDDGPRGFDVEHMADEWQGGDGYGRGDMGRGGGDGQGFGKGRGFEGHGDMGQGDMGSGFGDDQMSGQMSEQMDEMLRQFMDELGQGAGQVQPQG